jgi:adenosylcobinamide kinase/adenosylcobinamide-phosphate guanylyltransferase
MIVFVSGGARSGKSGVAERLAIQLSRTGHGQGGALYYLATARAGDAEMVQRIQRHRRQRGDGWITVEAPLALASTLAGIPHGSSVLLDCLTLWASQWLFQPATGSLAWCEDIQPGSQLEARGLAELDAALDCARRRRLSLVVVSNDLNEDLLPQQPLVWRYLAFLQRLHCRLASEAERVVEVVAGVAIDWKPYDTAPGNSTGKA